MTSMYVSCVVQATSFPVRSSRQCARSCGCCWTCWRTSTVSTGSIWSSCSSIRTSTRSSTTWCCSPSTSSWSTRGRTRRRRCWMNCLSVCSGTAAPWRPLDEAPARRPHTTMTSSAPAPQRTRRRLSARNLYNLLTPPSRTRRNRPVKGSAENAALKKMMEQCSRIGKRTQHRSVAAFRRFSPDSVVLSQPAVLFRHFSMSDSFAAPSWAVLGTALSWIYVDVRFYSSVNNSFRLLYFRRAVATWWLKGHWLSAISVWLGFDSCRHLCKSLIALKLFQCFRR